MAGKNSKGGDLFLDLRETLEEDLRVTGFSPSKEPPGTEPIIPPGLSSKSNGFLKDLYDEFLSYYAYLTDQVAQDTCYSSVSKARLGLKSAEATKRVASDSKLTNSDQRKAAVETDPDVVGALRDYTYFKAKLAVQEDRKRKVSKCMDRIGRELWFRTQNESDRDEDFFTSPPKQSTKSYPGAFKRIGNED